MSGHDDRGLEDTAMGEGLAEDADHEFEQAVERLCSAVRTVVDDEEVVDSEVIPSGVIEYVYSICSSRWVALRVLDSAHDKVCRRLRSDTDAARRKRWAKRWRPEEQEKTKALLRHARRVELGRVHREQACCHDTFTELPVELQFRGLARPRQFVVRDSRVTRPSIGLGAFLEQTPPALLQWLYEFWQGAGSERRGRPAVWDLTAGSGTSIDLLGTIHGCTVIASDLTVVGATGTIFADARQVGRLAGHRGVPAVSLNRPEHVVRRPNLILFDPPSRGTPTHARFYDGPASGDMADLDRGDYLDTIAAIVVRAVGYLAPGGLLSLLLRCGTRSRGRVIPEPSLLDDLRALLGAQVRIVHEMPLVYASVRRQASLGGARVPAVHLLIERVS